MAAVAGIGRENHVAQSFAVIALAVTGSAVAGIVAERAAMQVSAVKGAVEGNKIIAAVPAAIGLTGCALLYKRSPAIALGLAAGGVSASVVAAADLMGFPGLGLGSLGLANLPGLGSSTPATPQTPALPAAPAVPVAPAAPPKPPAGFQQQAQQAANQFMPGGLNSLFGQGPAGPASPFDVNQQQNPASAASPQDLQAFQDAYNNPYPMWDDSQNLGFGPGDPGDTSYRDPNYMGSVNGPPPQPGEISLWDAGAVMRSVPRPRRSSTDAGAVMRSQYNAMMRR